MIDPNNLQELPKGWVWAQLEEISDIIRGVSFPKEKKAIKPLDGYLACLRTTNIQKAVEWDDIFYIPEQFVKRPEQKVKIEDILISTANSLELVGKVAQIHSIPYPATIGAFISNIRVRPNIDAHFIYFQISSSEIQATFRQGASTTTNISNISSSGIMGTYIKVPPLPEQRRIVNKIEELFTRLDAGVEALKKIQLQLKRYRQSVLAAAFEGKLTAEWRKFHKSELEPASVLLEHIKAERKKKLGSKYKELPPVDTSELPGLPEGWAWERLNNLADIKGGVTVDNKRQIIRGRKIPYLRVANVQRGYFDLSEIKEIEADENTISELLLQKGDVLFNEGGDRDKLGRGWVWQCQIPECIHQNHVFRARLYSDNIQGKLVSWFGNTYGQKYFSDEGKQTTNLASVNLTKLSAFPVPISSSIEQSIIVTEIERLFSIADEIEKSVEESLTQSERLRQSILKQAFEGKLVQQDPHDEPAEKLLEQTRAGKAKLEGAKIIGRNITSH